MGPRSKFFDRFKELKSELECLLSSISVDDFSSNVVCRASLNRACEIIVVLKELGEVHRGLLTSSPVQNLQLCGVGVAVNDIPNRGGSVASVTLSKDKRLYSLFIDNLPINMGSLRLKRLFSKFGGVVDAYIPAKVGKNDRKFGFVRYANRNDGCKTINEMNLRTVDRRKLFVSWAKFNKKQTVKPSANGKYSQKWIPKKNISGALISNGLRTLIPFMVNNGLRNIGKEDTVVPDSLEVPDCDGSVDASSKTITDPIDVGLDSKKHASRLSYKDALLSGSKINRSTSTDPETDSDSDRTHSNPFDSFDGVAEHDIIVDIEESILASKSKGRSKRKLNMLMKFKWQLVRDAICRVARGQKGGQKVRMSGRANLSKHDSLDDIKADIERYWCAIP